MSSKMKIKLILLAVIFIFCVVSAGAEEKKKEDIPPGMEVKQISGSDFLVPKGANFTKKGDLIVLETAQEYVARRLSDMEERLAEIEVREAELDRKIEQINNTLLEIQKSDQTRDENAQAE